MSIDTQALDQVVRHWADCRAPFLGSRGVALAMLYNHLRFAQQKGWDTAPFALAARDQIISDYHMRLAQR